jgi:hemerythrin-like metal-binding protein
MPALTWNDDLALHQPHIDATHREFVALLAGVEAALDADPATLGAALDDFIAHSESHFAQENNWMLRVGFGAGHCHGTEHAQVLELMHEVRRRLREQGDVRVVRSLVPALAQWFPIHAGSMDAGLAEVMLARGFNPDTGEMLKPPGDEAGADAACEHLIGR